MNIKLAQSAQRTCVVACCDQRMLPAACVALLTAHNHLLAKSVSLCLVGQNLDTEDIAKFQAFCAHHAISIELLKFDAAKNSGKLAHMPTLTSATFLRLHLDELLPPDFDRVIYLDSDIIVTNDISELVTYDLRQNIVGAVPDVINTFRSMRKHIKEIGLQPGALYFNAGMLVFNWPLVLQKNLLARARKMAGEKSDYMFHDQDILNILCRNEWLKLDLRFNASIHAMSAGGPVAIAHFAGVEKPWRSCCFYRHAPYRKIYQALLADAEWPDFVERIKFRHRLLWPYEPVLWFIQRGQGRALA